MPLLIGVFGIVALPAIMNKAMSLIVVITAIPARLISVPLPELSPYLYIVLNLLAGRLIGAWIGAHWATKLGSKALYRVIAVLLVLIALGAGLKLGLLRSTRPSPLASTIASADP